MKKVETLRAGSEFSRVLLHGRRVEGRLLRCHYLLCEDQGRPIRVGFAVPSREYNAVRRNRIKRLLREAWSRERLSLDALLTAGPVQVALIFFFKGEKGFDVDRVKLHTLQEDVRRLCRSVVTNVGSGASCQRL